MCGLSSTNTLELIAKVCDMLFFVATLELNIPSLSPFLSSFLLSLKFQKTSPTKILIYQWSRWILRTEIPCPQK